MRTLEEALALVEERTVVAAVRAALEAVRGDGGYQTVGTVGEGDSNGEYDEDGDFQRYFLAGDVVGVYGVKR